MGNMRIPVAVSIPLEADAQALFQAADFRGPCVLLESARTHPVTGRYSILAGEPDQVLTSRDAVPDAGSFRRLERLLEDGKAASVPGLPPFVGGAIGYFGYDACRFLERIPSLARDDLNLPEWAFLFFSQAAVLDHQERKLWCIALADGPAGVDGARARAERLLQRVTRAPTTLAQGDFIQPNSEICSTHTRDSFESMVRRAKSFIAEGEIYQANLSQRFDLPLPASPWQLYRRLTRINPSPFAAFADFSATRCGGSANPFGGGFQVASASPERLLRVAGETAETRPIAGTRPRGGSAVETARLRTELLLNEKERAEHLMLVDLERNDLGRICRYGSVRVDDLMGVEEYSHVIHIVSNVQGQLRPGLRLSDWIRAVFPGGTITGCPKIRCMEIIEELEPVRRQLYTGSLGYFSADGHADLNILIRTAFATQGRLYFQAGAGIVADSDPAREYDETLHKARALVEALTVHAPVLV